MPKIGDGGQRAERRENGGRPDDSDNAEDSGDDEPDQHHRPEYAADKGRAVALDEKQDDEDRDRQRDYGAPHLRRINLQPLDRAQDRNRRRYRAVAVQQGGADEADHDHCRPPFVALGAPRADQSEQRQNAAFAVVVGAHDQDRVFDGDDDDQRPEDQRHDANHRFWRNLSAGTRGLRGDIESIERARADVAEHDAHARQRRRRPRARAHLPGHCVNLRRCAHWARPSPDDSLTEAETAPIACGWQPETPPNDPEKTIAPLGRAEEPLAERSAKAPAKRLWGPRKGVLDLGRWHQQVSWIALSNSDAPCA